MTPDQATFARAFPPLAADKLWVSHGLVAPESDGQKSVLFDDEQGNPLPYPVVMVILQPSGTTVPCRVASPVAGVGEGTWVPFIDGDEVLVAVAEGHERAGCVIIGRLNQRLDAWPRRVAGQDATANTFSFRRTIPPHIEETVGGYLIRSAKTGAFLGIDTAGQVTIANGDAAQLHIGADFLGLATADTTVTVQLNPSSQTLYLQGNTATITLDDKDGVTILTPKQLIVGSAGFQPTGHAVTAEQVLVLIVATLMAYSAAIGAGSPGALTGAGLAALFATPVLTNPVLATALLTAQTLPIDPTLTAALQVAMSVTPDPTVPSYGKPGFLF